MLTILFDGIAYGMLLFVLACGLSITLGLMNFINLAHGVFAMAGGYVTVVMMNRYGISFYWCLPAAFVVAALFGVVLERLLYRRLYSASHLDQVLFSIGLVFMAIAAVDYFMGGQQQMINLPPSLRGRFEFAGIGIGRYRLFIVIIWLSTAPKALSVFGRATSCRSRRTDRPRDAMYRPISSPGRKNPGTMCRRACSTSRSTGWIAC